MAAYSMIVAFCNELAPEWRKAQRENLIWSMYGLFMRRSLTLSHLAQHFPAPTQPKVRRVKHGLWYRLKRLRRFLFDPRLALEPLAQRLNYLALAPTDAPRVLVPVLVDLTYSQP